MGMYVQHNMSSMNANRMLGITTSAQAKSTEKLSSGYRINRAADDAAGLAISEKMRGQIRGLNKASSNAQDGISMIQTAEGALTETHSIIQRMRELAVQSSNDTNTDDDRTQIQNEIDQLTQEVDRIATTTEFNTKKLLDGSRVGSVTEKNGTAKVDSTFGNSTVSAEITTNGSDKAAFTDVIRVEITKDFTAGQSTKDTPKLSDKDIDNFVSLLTKAGAVDFGDGASVTGTAAATESSQERIDKAKDVVDAALQAAKEAASKSANATAKNEKTIETTVDNVFAISKKSTNTTSGKAILVDGTTKDDLTEKLNNYINALVENGDAATGKSTAITEAETALAALFDTTTTDTIGTAIAGTEDLGAAHYDATNAAVAKTTPSAAATTVDIKTVAADVLAGLKTYAKSIAGVEITNINNNKKLDRLQSVADTLADDDLIGAVSDYANAKTALAGVTSDDAKIAEYQAKVDDARAALDKLNVAGSVLTVTDLFGSTDDSKNFSIASKVADDGSLTISMKNKSGDDTVITISNADKLKAGDVITITSQEMVESKQAATGNEAFRLQVGANAGQEVSLGINSMRAKDLNLVQTKEGVEGKALDVTTQAGASLAVNAYDMALQKVSTERAKMGAVQNRLEHTISNLDTAAENTQNAESRIRDTDMAKEMVEYSKNNILAQAGQSMLAQANQSTQGILSLLG